jgi:hypothetical protein
VGARLYFGVWKFEGEGAWERLHAGVLKPQNTKGVFFKPWVIARGHQVRKGIVGKESTPRCVLVQNREEHRKGGEREGFL